MPMSPFSFISMAVVTACKSDFSSMPARIKQALSSASGRSVEVLIQTAGNGLPTLVKKEENV